MINHSIYQMLLANWQMGFKIKLLKNRKNETGPNFYRNRIFLPKPEQIFSGTGFFYQNRNKFYTF